MKTQNKCHFHDAIDKYGFDKFEYQVLEEFTSDSKDELRELLNEAEIKWIRIRDSYNNGYNMTTGGQYVFDTNKCSHSGSQNPCAKDRRRHITNGIENRFVKVSDLDQYFEDGWTIGYAPRDWSERNKKTSEKRKGQPSPRKGVKLGDSTRKLLSENMLGRIRLTNGVINVMATENEVQHYLDMGYRYGMTRKQKNIIN